MKPNNQVEDIKLIITQFIFNVHCPLQYLWKPTQLLYCIKGLRTSTHSHQPRSNSAHCSVQFTIPTHSKAVKHIIEVAGELKDVTNAWTTDPRLFGKVSYIDGSRTYDTGRFATTKDLPFTWTFTDACRQC